MLGHSNSTPDTCVSHSDACAHIIHTPCIQGESQAVCTLNVLAYLELVVSEKRARCCRLLHGHAGPGSAVRNGSMQGVLHNTPEVGLMPGLLTCMAAGTVSCTRALLRPSRFRAMDLTRSRWEPPCRRNTWAPWMPPPRPHPAVWCTPLQFHGPLPSPDLRKVCDYITRHQQHRATDAHPTDDVH